MVELFEENLRRVSLLDIYDDIAAIRITPQQLMQWCIEIPCSVDLKRGNVVYSVEQKYKDKLSKYGNTKRLKWLNLNLNTIVPNPEEKLLKWQKRHRENKKHDWILRKLHILDQLVNETLKFQSEDPCASHSLHSPAEKRMSDHISHSSRRSHRDVDTSCSTSGNTSTESLQTVIRSQQKSIEDTGIGDGSSLIDLQYVSRSSLSSGSGELPSLCVESAPTSEQIEPQTEAPLKDKRKREAPTHRKPLLPASEGPLSQEAYASFYQDMQVTSTQEFGF